MKYEPRDIRRYKDPCRLFTVVYHKDVIDPDKYRLAFGTHRTGLRKLPEESAAALWSRVLSRLADLQSARFNKRFALWQCGLPGSLIPHAYIYPQEYAVDRKLKERLAFAESRARRYVRGKDSLKSTDKASFVRLLIQIGQEHPDGLTRVRALCRAADLMNWRTTDVDDADRPIMYVPEIAELDDWERIAAESQRMLLFDTRDGAPISRSSR